MTDYFKMFVIALVTSVATQLLLTPYVLRLQGFTIDRPPELAGKVEKGTGAGPVAEVKLAAPNLEGMTVADARDRWREKVAIIEDGVRAGSGAKPGTIVSQRPAPGAELASKEIHVIVAEEAGQVGVPDVVGKKVDEARAELVKAGFEVPDPKVEASEKPKGTIIKTIPNPGAQSDKGSEVQMIVAEAPAIEVPKVQGMRLSKAKKALVAAGLAVGRVRRVEHPERGENSVLRQTPAAGESVPPGTEVEMVVVSPN